MHGCKHILCQKGNPRSPWSKLQPRGSRDDCTYNYLADNLINTSGNDKIPGLQGMSDYMTDWHSFALTGTGSS